MNNEYAIRRSKRQGFTLIEVIGTLSLLLAIALAGTSMLATVTKIGLANKQANQARADIARLAIQFRADVRNAQLDQLHEDSQAIDLSIGDQVIRYQFDPRTQVIVRKRVDSGQEPPLDFFTLTEHCFPAFAVQDRQVNLRLTEPDARNPWIIQAVQHD